MSEIDDLKLQILALHAENERLRGESESMRTESDQCRERLYRFTEKAIHPESYMKIGRENLALKAGLTEAIGILDGLFAGRSADAARIASLRKLLEGTK